MSPEKSNNKISITAEFVALMKSRKDERYNYFVSPKTRRIYFVVRFIIPKSFIQKIFTWRLQISEMFVEKIKNTDAIQFIEMGCGFNLRGFDLCLKHKNIIWIDIDLGNVIERKEAILKVICNEKNVQFPKNYKPIAADAINDDIFGKTKDFISSNKKTLILAEGLTSYFSDEEFRKFLRNIKKYADENYCFEFFSSENIKTAKRSIVFKAIRFFVSLITFSKAHKRFSSEIELKSYMKSTGFREVETEIKFDSLFYSIINPC